MSVFAPNLTLSPIWAADGVTGVDQRSVADVRADVDEGGAHQNRVAADVGPPADDGAVRRVPGAALREVVGRPEREDVVVVDAAVRVRLDPSKSEVEQDALFDPAVGGPLAVLPLGGADLAGLEGGQKLVEEGAFVGSDRLGGQPLVVASL